MARSLVSGSIVSLLMLPALAQKPGKDNQSGYDRSAKATLVHPADVYAAPDGDSMKAALVNPGTRW